MRLNISKFGYPSSGILYTFFLYESLVLHVLHSEPEFLLIPIPKSGNWNPKLTGFSLGLWFRV